MTFDDDFLQLNTEQGVKRLLCKKAGVEWPPPERINFAGFIYERARYSQITDEQRKDLTMLMRGAEYNLIGIDDTAASAHYN